MPSRGDRGFEGSARTSARHIMATFDPPTWGGTPSPSSKLHGLSEEVADEVLTLRLGDFETDLAELLPRLVCGADVVSWPREPPKLPPAPLVTFTMKETEEIQERNRQADRLSELTPERIETENMSERDLEPLRTAARRRRVAQLRPDALAFYRRFSTLSREQAARDVFSSPPEWGVYLTTGGIETIAQEVFIPTAMSDQDRLRCATAFLLGHELGHLLTDGALADDDLARWGSSGKRTEPLAAAHRNKHGGAACPAEEAFCECYALSFLDDALATMPLDDAMRQAAQVAALQHVADGLPGYRDGARIRTSQARFEQLRDLLDHAGITHYPDRAALIADLDRRVLPAFAVPIHLVVTRGSAFTGKQWAIGHSR